MLKRVYRIPALVVIAVITMAVLLRLLDLAPYDEVAVPLPIASAIAHMQEGVVVVETPQGRLRHEMWENWGPATRASLYVTPEGWLVVLGGPAVATMISVSGGGPPALVAEDERKRTRSESWLYIGAVDKEEKTRRLRFYSPGEQRECFAMYGEGESPYRKDHQVERSCS